MLSPFPVSPLPSPYPIPLSSLPPPTPDSHCSSIALHWGIKPPQDQGPPLPLMPEQCESGVGGGKEDRGMGWGVCGGERGKGIII